MRLFNNEKKKKIKINWLRFIFLGGFLIRFFSYFLNKEKRENLEKNFKDFFYKEKTEIEKLSNGNMSFKKYIINSCGIFADYFVPVECNDYKPKILRTKSLVSIAIFLLLVKAVAVSYLFFSYPSMGRMAEMITREIYELINQERTANNVRTLALSDRLVKPAQLKADDMVANSYFAHKSPNGKMPWDWINKKEYPYVYAGENLAMNFTTALSAHRALMLSESHKKNILNANYSDIGIAIANGRVNERDTNVLVELFGTAKQELKLTSTPEILKKKIENNKKPVVNNTKKQGGVTKIDSKTKVLAAENQVLATEKINMTEGEKAESEALVKEKELEENLVLAPKEIKIKEYQKIGFATNVIVYSKYILLSAFIIITILFLINIFVKISVQHKPVIIQTLALLIFIASLIAVKIHFLEGISDNIIIF